MRHPQKNTYPCALNLTIKAGESMWNETLNNLDRFQQAGEGDEPGAVWRQGRWCAEFKTSVKNIFSSNDVTNVGVPRSKKSAPVSQEIKVLQLTVVDGIYWSVLWPTSIWGNKRSSCYSVKLDWLFLKKKV